MFLRLTHDGFAFPPARIDFSCAYSIDILTRGRGATVANQVCLQITRETGIPLGKPYGDPLL